MGICGCCVLYNQALLLGLELGWPVAVSISVSSIHSLPPISCFDLVSCWLTMSPLPRATKTHMHTATLDLIKALIKMAVSEDSALLILK